MHKENRGGVARACAWGTKRAMHPEGRFESHTPARDGRQPDPK
jgi:hypothetical protein